MAPASATPTAGASGYKAALKAVVTGTEPAAPAASTLKDDYLYIRVPREKVAPVDTESTESTMFLRALGRKMPHQSFSQFRCSYPHPRRSSVFEITVPFRTRVSRSCSLAGLAIRA